MERIPNDIKVGRTEWAVRTEGLLYSVVLPATETEPEEQVYFVISVAFCANSTAAILCDENGDQLTRKDISDELYRRIKWRFMSAYTNPSDADRAAEAAARAKAQAEANSEPMRTTHIRPTGRIFLYCEDHVDRARALWDLSIHRGLVMDLNYGSAFDFVERMAKAAPGTSCDELFKDELTAYRNYIQNSSAAQMPAVPASPSPEPEPEAESEAE